MKINDTIVYHYDLLSSLYPALPEFKRRHCEELSKQGYVFFVNNTHAMDTQRRWEHYDLVRVMRSKKVKPAVLWAVRPLRKVGADRANASNS